MKYVNLGATGLRVSRVCLGMMSYGNDSDRPWVLDEDAAEPIVKAAVDGGITFFDTADVYSGGASEVATGRLLAKFFRREEVVVATKVYGAMGAGRERARPVPQAHPVRHRRVAAQAGHGLRRPLPDPPLGPPDARSRRRWRRCTTWCGPARPATSAPAACSRGSSPRPSTWPMRTGWTRFVSMQNHYNLIYREEEREMIPQCVDQGVGRDPVEPAGPRRAGRQPDARGRAQHHPVRHRRVRRHAVQPGRGLRRGGRGGGGRGRAGRAPGPGGAGLAAGTGPA